MSQQFQFSLRRLFVMVVLIAVGLTLMEAGMYAAINGGGPKAVFVLEELFAAAIGAAVGVLADRPWLFAAIGAVSLLPVIFVVKLFI